MGLAYPMKTKILTLFAAGCLLAGCKQNQVEQASHEFNQLPAPVQATIREKAPNAEIADIKKHDRNGLAVYAVQFRDKERYPAMEVAADGMLVKYEAGSAAIGAPGKLGGQVKGRVASALENEYSALPLNVQKQIDANAPRAEVVDIRRKEENGQAIYEIEYAGSRDHKPVLRIGADGHILKKPDEAEPVK